MFFYQIAAYRSESYIITAYRSKSYHLIQFSITPPLVMLESHSGSDFTPRISPPHVQFKVQTEMYISFSMKLVCISDKINAKEPHTSLCNSNKSFMTSLKLYLLSGIYFKSLITEVLSSHIHMFWKQNI